MGLDFVESCDNCGSLISRSVSATNDLQHNFRVSDDSLHLKHNLTLFTEGHNFYFELPIRTKNREKELEFKLCCHKFLEMDNCV